VDRTHAQSFLPPGFVAAESSRFFGQPEAPAGKAVVVASLMQCADHYTEALVAVFVRAPVVNGSALPGDHFYELGRATAGDLASTLASLGWPLLGGEVEARFTAAPTPSGSGSAKDGNGTWFSAIVPSAPVMDAFSGTLNVHYWHETDNGLARSDYSFTPDGFLGEGICEARAGSLIATVIQGTDCSQGSLFMVGPAFDLVGAFNFHPGIHADG
jgi:hypothetical protein